MRYFTSHISKTSDATATSSAKSSRAAAKRPPPMEPPSSTPPMLGVPLAATVATEAKAELERIQRAILEKTQHLLSCSEVELPRVARELQRLRVALITLNELVTNIADPTAKQEIGLLSKMLLGRTESSASELIEADEEDAAEERLRALGINPDAADSMARGLRALQAVMETRGRDGRERTPTPTPAAPDAAA
jgi:hypothetical protein